MHSTSPQMFRPRVASSHLSRTGKSSRQMMLVKQLESRPGVTVSRATLKTADRCHLTEPLNSPLSSNLSAATAITLSSILDKFPKVVRARVGQLDCETRPGRSMRVVVYFEISPNDHTRHGLAGDGTPPRRNLA